MDSRAIGDLEVLSFGLGGTRKPPDRDDRAVNCDGDASTAVATATREARPSKPDLRVGRTFVQQ